MALKIKQKKEWSALGIIGLTILTMFVTSYVIAYYRMKELAKTDGTLPLTPPVEENTEVDTSNGLTRNFYRSNVRGAY